MTSDILEGIIVSLLSLFAFRLINRIDIRQPVRFSLRLLFIATTAIAVLLGLMAVATFSGS